MNFFILSLIKVAVVAFVLLTTLAYLQWIERKVIAHIQLRVGPYRVGPHGLLQPLADVVKLITKEGVIPSHVNKFFYLMAPFVAVTLALISISVIPFGPEITIGPVTTWMQLTDLHIGILFVLAVSSVGVYGVALGGWASNNKYSLLGGLRSSAQMISYELPLALAIAAPLLLANTLSFREMVNYQSGYWLGFIPRWNVIPRDSRIHRFPDRRLRRNQSRAVRSSRSRKRTGGRLPHRVQQHEVRRVLHGRIRQHGDRHRGRDAAVPGRLAAAVPGAVFGRRPDPGLRVGRADRHLSRAESGAPHGQVHVAGRGRWCSWASPRSSACRSSFRC